jgi:hypothetical protein
MIYSRFSEAEFSAAHAPFSVRSSRICGGSQKVALISGIFNNGGGLTGPSEDS